MRISDWSSDVCSSDLSQSRTAAAARHRQAGGCHGRWQARRCQTRTTVLVRNRRTRHRRQGEIGRASCRERVCQYGVDLGGRRIIKKKKYNEKDNERKI